MKSLFSISVLTLLFSQFSDLSFLHNLLARLRPEGTPDISRWWNHRVHDLKTSSPGGATDRDRSVALSGLGGSTCLVPVVPPPANLHRASGAKIWVETSASAQGRDLSGYEKMEHTIDGTKESGEPYIVKEREFIWNCWRQKRRCFTYLKVELKDTPPSVVQIYVEPNEKGVWNAVYMLDAQPLDKKGKPKGKPVSWQYSLMEMVRVEATDSFKKVKEIPDDEVRTADTYKIYLKSSKSAVKQGFGLFFRRGGPGGLIF